MIKTVFISGPYTQGDVIINIRRVIDCAETLSKLGYLPYIPHLNYSWHLVHPHDPQFWYDFDLEWLRKCDCVLRLEGESPGADNEVILAESLGIPVCYKIGDLWTTLRV